MVTVEISGLYSPPANSHKGQNGKLLVIGGSRQYHGAPMFSLLAARRFVDLLYFYPGEDDEQLLNAIRSIPEAMVVDDLKPERLQAMDCILFGIGLGKARPPELQSIIKATKQLVSGQSGHGQNTKLVLDGDGLMLINGKIPAGSIITPHEGEFKKLFELEGTEENVIAMAQKLKCVILKKGPVDVIADGRSDGGKSGGVVTTKPGTPNPKLVTNALHNQGMTKGGTGDVLAGLVAALACKNDAFVAAVAGARINGLAGNLLTERYGYNYCASDLANALAKSAQLMKEWDAQQDANKKDGRSRRQGLAWQQDVI